MTYAHLLQDLLDHNKRTLQGPVRPPGTRSEQFRAAMAMIRQANLGRILRRKALGLDYDAVTERCASRVYTTWKRCADLFYGNMKFRVTSETRLTAALLLDSKTCEEATESHDRTATAAYLLGLAVGLVHPEIAALVAAAAEKASCRR
jgi:hypothetical protein